MSNGIFGPHVKFTDTIQCPSCKERRLVSQLVGRQAGNSPPWYACPCKPDEPIVADPGDGRIQIFQEFASCLVRDENPQQGMGITLIDRPPGLGGL